MTTNFDFLKKIDFDLYEIAAEAEKLYRDEYFEQSMTQTRRFAEQVCKNVLGERRKNEQTFDEMLATLKDKSCGSEEEKEFLDDLYFIKKHGNFSAHSSKVNKDGIKALECLQRAFETAINYAVYYKNSSKNILNLHYDIQLLATGEKDETLEEKYRHAKTKLNENKNVKKSEKKQKNKPVYSKKTSQNPMAKNLGTTIYWALVLISFLISFVIILLITFL